MTTTCSRQAHAAVEPPKTAVWIQPVGTVVVPLVTSLTSLGGSSHAWNMFSAGATHDLGPIDLVSEFGWARTTRVNIGSGEEISVAMGLWLALGVALHTGNESLSGFFFEPRLQLGLLYEAMSRFRTSYTVQLGLNVGYQWVIARRLYIALILGGSIGVGSAQDNVLEGPLFSGVFAPQPISMVVGFNAHLLRIGFAF